MKPLASKAQGPLIRAIQQRISSNARFSQATDKIDRQTPRIVIQSATSVDWASITFSGQRHAIEVWIDLAEQPDPAAIDDFNEALSSAEIVLPRQIVAEIAIVAFAIGEIPGSGWRLVLTIEALTLDD